MIKDLPQDSKNRQERGRHTEGCEKINKKLHDFLMQLKLGFCYMVSFAYIQTVYRYQNFTFIYEKWGYSYLNGFMFECNVGLLIAYLPVHSQNIARFSTGLMEVFHLFVMIIISADSIRL